MPNKTGMFLFGVPAVLFNKADYLNEIFVTKNSAYSKHVLERTMGMPLVRNAIVSMETEDPTYKVKRKVLSAAFMKSKMDAIRYQIKE